MSDGALMKCISCGAEFEDKMVCPECGSTVIEQIGIFEVSESKNVSEFVK